MSVATNKSVIHQWVDAVNGGDELRILSLLTKDFLFKSMARSPEWIIHSWGAQQFAAAPRAMSSLLQTPIVMEIAGMIAEGDQVSVEAQTDSLLKNGKRYNNAYHFVFEFNDGKIAEVREYCCSYLVEHCFGEFNPNNPSAGKAGAN